MRLTTPLAVFLIATTALVSPGVAGQARKTTGTVGKIAVKASPAKPDTASVVVSDNADHLRISIDTRAGGNFRITEGVDGFRLHFARPVSFDLSGYRKPRNAASMLRAIDTTDRDINVTLSGSFGLDQHLNRTDLVIFIAPNEEAQQKRIAALADLVRRKPPRPPISPAKLPSEPSAPASKTPTPAAARGELASPAEKHANRTKPARMPDATSGPVARPTHNSFPTHRSLPTPDRESPAPLPTPDRESLASLPAARSDVASIRPHDDGPETGIPTDPAPSETRSRVRVVKQGSMWAVVHEPESPAGDDPASGPTPEPASAAAPHLAETPHAPTPAKPEIRLKTGPETKPSPDAVRREPPRQETQAAAPRAEGLTQQPDAGRAAAQAASHSPSEASVAEPDAAAAASAQPESAAPPAKPPANGPFLTPQTWLAPDYSRELSALIRKMAEADDPVEAGIGIARLDFSHQFHAEGAELLRGLAFEFPDVLNDPATALLYAALSVMDSRGDGLGALDGLTGPATPEMRFWRGAADLRRAGQDLGAKRRAVSEMTAVASVILPYPAEIQSEIALLGLEAAVQTGDTAGAQFFEALARSASQGLGNARPALLARIDYWRGWLADRAKRQDQALALWAAAAENAPEPTRSLAQLEAVRIRIASGFLAPETAIAELEQIRMFWPGAVADERLLEVLGDAYLASKNIRESFALWKGAAATFPQSQWPRLRLRDLLAGLRNGTVEANALDRLTVLAGAADLVPEGPEGAAMARDFSVELARAGLAEDASSLLDRASLNASPADQVEIAITRSGIMAASGDIQGAQGSLDAVRARALAGDSKIRWLTAAASLKLREGRPEDGAQILQAAAVKPSEDPDKLILRTRVDLLWAAKNWAGAAALLREIVPVRPAAGPPDAETARNVSRLATALALAGNAKEASSLGQAWTKPMLATEHGPLFLALTESDAGAEGGGAASVQRAIKRAETLAAARAALK